MFLVNLKVAQDCGEHGEGYVKYRDMCKAEDSSCLAAAATSCLANSSGNVCSFFTGVGKEPCCNLVAYAQSCKCTAGALSTTALSVSAIVLCLAAMLMYT
eukprot:GDKI01007313.1.p1 GENE.GDKI01007313.1~~GDKI01007313.1.p1  ORF type:complete len:100 (-),score=29.43 GDKI01007313.1:130-429(-)